MTDAYRPLPGSRPASFSAGDPSAPPPWPPPGVSGPPPTVGPAPGAPVGASAGPVGGAGPGPGDGSPPDDDAFRPARWVYVVIPVLILALIGFLFWRSRDSDDGTSTPTLDSTVFPTTSLGSPPVDSTPGGSTPDGSATTLPGPGATPAPTAPGDTSGTVTAPGGSLPTSDPLAPGATTVAPGTSPGAGTTPATGPAPTETVPPLTSRSLLVAQDMASALADGDWSEVRRLSPTDTRSTADLERDYAGLETSTIVPANETTLSSGLVDLRLGLVAEEARDTGPQTSLFCVHWIVDPLGGTVQRLDAARLRTVGGTVPAAQVAPELAATCATIPLR